MDEVNTEEVIDSVDQEFKEHFIQSVDSKMNVKMDYEKQSVDYDWLDQFEETMHYIDIFYVILSVLLLMKRKLLK